MSGHGLNLPNPMVTGLEGNNFSKKMNVAHPLEASEKAHFQVWEQREYAMLNRTEGIQAPLKLQMERRATLKTGHLPFLPRSNASFNALVGRDETVEFEDFLGHPHEPEVMGNPHAMMERKLGLL